MTDLYTGEQAPRRNVVDFFTRTEYRHIPEGFLSPQRKWREQQAECTVMSGPAIHPGSELMDRHGARGFIVMREVFAAQDDGTVALQHYEVSRRGIRSTLRPEQIQQVLS